MGYLLGLVLTDSWNTKQTHGLTASTTTWDVPFQVASNCAPAPIASMVKELLTPKKNIVIELDIGLMCYSSPILRIFCW